VEIYGRKLMFHCKKTQVMVIRLRLGIGLTTVLVLELGLGYQSYMSVILIVRSRPSIAKDQHVARGCHS